MSSSLSRNDRLRRENQFLSMQHSRYDNLRTAIEETRQVRHDMRHHFNILQSHYGLQYRKQNIPCTFELDLSCELPVPEIDLCLVLFHMVLLSVENTFDGDIREKDGYSHFLYENGVFCANVIK